MMKKLGSFLYRLLFFGAISAGTGILLYWRYQFGLHRYFDIDEFAHLKWAHDAFIGLRPYTDFFYFFPPLYLYLLFPLFAFLGKTTAVLIGARILSFAIFVICALALFVIAAKIAGKKTALFAVFVFAFLPIPQDKWLEVRPDGIATLMTLLGILFLILYVKKRNAIYAFLSGLTYATAVLVVPKVAPFALVGGAVFLLSLRNKMGNPIRNLTGFAVGIIIPVLIVFLLFISYGDVRKALYLTVKVSSDATAVLGKKFTREADLNFRPNSIYFGLDWYSLGWKTNLAVWILGSLWAIKKFVSILDEKDGKSSLISLLLSASYWVNFIIYVKFIDLRHPQYLIPLSVLVSYYFAEGVIWFSSRLPRVSARLLTSPLPSPFRRGDTRGEVFGIGKISTLIPLASFIFSDVLLLIVAGVLYNGAAEMMGVKLRWDNSGDLAYYDRLYTFLPPKERVMDLTGEMIFYPEGYYFCCVPYGQYEEALTFSYPNLEKELRRNKVKFIYVQWAGRIGILPAIQQKVLGSFYVPYTSPVTSSFFVAGAKITSTEPYETHYFDIISEGTYELVWQGIAALSSGVSNWVKIDGKPAPGNPVYLTQGKHTISIAGAGEMVIRYTW